MRTPRTTLLAILLIQSMPAFAGLGAPTGVSSSGVLPMGVSNPRFTTIYGSYGEKLNGTGDLEPVGFKLAKRVRWSDVMKVQKSDSDRRNMENILRGHGLTLGDTPGNSTSDVNVTAVAFVPTFAYGVTDRLTLGVGVPIVKMDVTAETGFVKNSDAQKVIDTICDRDPVKCNEITQQFATAVDQMTNYYGYEPVRSQNKTSIGDVRFVGKYRLWENQDEAVSVSGEITAPTGTKADPDKIIDLSTGDGQWDFGVTTAYDRKRIIGDLGWGVYGGYTLQTADTVEKRIPKEGELLDPDKEFVKRNLGDRLAVGTGVNYEFPKAGITLGTGYHLQYTTKTTFSGTQFSEDRYRLLEGSNPSETLHSASVSATFSTVGFYRQKQVSVPLDAGLSYGRILSGRNVSMADRISAEIVLYF